MERTLQAKRAATRAKGLRQQQVCVLGVRTEVQGLECKDVRRGRLEDDSRQRADRLMSLAVHMYLFEP